jgi:hypothetical protein
MKILPGMSISRVVQCCTAIEGCHCSRDTKRSWVKPYFGVRFGHHWFFPIGTGMRLNKADAIREDVKWFLWVLGITGWVRAARDVTRDGARRTLSATRSRARSRG